ncbi:MAG: EamA family transporter [Rhizobiales bacterium]|nr:EamA family transporter [Hyphomicrobiales bacterium]
MGAWRRARSTTALWKGSPIERLRPWHATARLAPWTRHAKRHRVTTSPPASPPAAVTAPIAQLAPAVIAATAFAVVDILIRWGFEAGADSLTMVMVRGLIGVPLLYAWIRFGVRPKPMTPREKWISLGFGVLFAGNVYLLFVAIEAMPVPAAILTYFVYPLLTGLIGAATRLDTLTWRGLTAALAAFLGLGLMLGAHPGGLALIGILAGLGAAACRTTTLILTRAMLPGADARLITWYSLISSTVLFCLVALATGTWNPPQTGFGWACLVGIGVFVTVGLLGVFMSTMRIGPFRTALFMNLEPLLATIGAALFLGEVITPLQALGGAVMIAALVVFQLRR